ncbi:ATP-dependent helicase [Candidatus Woesearchaeota archaeon]|nr:ATP-dependent helicase [Candidatus Woesearchaeota archaeon]
MKHIQEQQIIKKEQPNNQNELVNILHPFVKQWFFSKFKEFSLPQLYGVMEIHSRKNILISAPTGATKTLTGFMAILNELVDTADKGILENKIYAVYVSPLKALNYDIEHNLITPLKEIEAITGKRLGIRVAVRTGDTTQKEKIAMLKNSPHILITTPESLAILITSVKFRDYLKDVQWCIVDEIHALAENKRGVYLSLSLERLNHISPSLARVGLSATIAPIEEIAKYLVGSRNCTVVELQFLKQLDMQVISPVKDLINVSHNDLHHELYTLIDKLVQEHKTTLIFTNTRAATERVVHHLKEKFPKNYTENIGAHHGSLSKSHRHNIETRLREGKIKVVVCSTSLELGIDIGYIDLVLCLGSPKSVARALQRIGRSGHQLHAVTKGRIIVLDRDDLVECSVLLKAAVEKKIDRIHIPRNSLDVLAQQIYGMAIEQVWDENELFETIKKSYCYFDLKKSDFEEILSFLAGEFSSLEDRNIYAKIWRNDGKIGRRGKMARVIYMTNIGTIPDQTGVEVKIGTQTIGFIDEGFLEKLKKRDVFVLGGSTYEFRFAQGMVCQVTVSAGKPPTVPSWVSEMLPLSFDLSLEIGRFRRLMEDKFLHKLSHEDILTFIHEFLYVDKNAAEAIYNYFRLQYEYVKEIPHDKKILIEHYNDREESKIMVHSLFGRRVNDVLSRAIAFAISRSQKRDVEIGIDDNGFYISCEKNVNVLSALKLLKADKLKLVMENAIEQTEVLKRRFRHCAQRSLMILRTYKGRTKNVGRQQVSSMILLAAVRRISPNFSIIKEARREVLEDLMDIENAMVVLRMIEEDKIKIKEIHTSIPTPFAFNLVMQGYTDILKIEDKVEFLKRMHQMVIAKIALQKKNISEDKQKDFLKNNSIDYHELWKKSEDKKKLEEEEGKQHLKFLAYNLKHVPTFAKEQIIKIIDGETDDIRADFIEDVKKYRKEIEKEWPKELKELVLNIALYDRRYEAARKL